MFQVESVAASQLFNEAEKNPPDQELKTLLTSERVTLERKQATIIVSSIAFANNQILKYISNINEQTHKIPVVLWLRQPSSISKERGSKPCPVTGSSCSTWKTTKSHPEVL